MRVKHFVLLSIFQFYFGILNAQSISATKIYEYLSSQNSSTISKDIQSKGFIFKSTSKAPNGNTTYYIKDSSFGHEAFAISTNDELFSVMYKPVSSFYNGYREKMFTSDFIYSYSVGKNKYYENGQMRIGLNSEDGILSFFVVLN